ncbi:MAG: transglutaminase-like cysteine peptidase [Geminicoccaceae bacterium]
MDVRRWCPIAALMMFIPMALASGKPMLSLAAAPEPAAGMLAGPTAWNGLLQRLRHDAPLYALCESDPGMCPTAGLAAWSGFIARTRSRPETEQIEAVQTFVNRQPYRPDLETFGVSDHWATPLEFFAAGGDCEDYAIAKYVTLRRLGVAADRLRIAVLEDRRRHEPHAVLTVFTAGGTLVLDNLAPQPVPVAAVPHYAPYYAVNELHRWDYTSVTSQAHASAAAP